MKQAKAAMRKLNKREKEEQWRESVEQGAFKMKAGWQQLIDHFRVIMDRHRRHQMKRNQIQLGHVPLDPRVQSKHYDREMVVMRDGCNNQDMFQFLLENYNDECFSMDYGPEDR